jgi:drug/metabolite transporter (DMT)-like permease
MKIRVVLVLGAGIAAVSSAAILIRLAAAPALATASWRLAIATILLLPVWAWRARRRAHAAPPRRRSAAALLAAGGFLALHFGLWIASLSRTTVASSVTLVALNPMFVAVFARVLLGERISRRTAAGMAVAIAGSLVIGGADFRPGSRALSGDLMALGGAVAGALYLVTGRALRNAFALVPYILAVYGTAALVLTGAAVAFQVPLWGYPLRTYVLFFLLAALPQMVGHTSFNYALRHLPASMVSIVILSEPVGASLLAWLILAEVPSAGMMAGGVLVLAGIAAAAIPGAVSAAQSRD